MPEPPFIAAGALGGPFVIYLVTPMRNALTLGTLDSSKSAIRLYRDVFRGGFMAGFAGGQYMSVAAVPGFMVLGPCFHMFKDLCGGSSTAATALTAVAETAVFFGSETKNAQVAYNADAAKKGTKPIAKLHSQYMPVGKGVGFHVARKLPRYVWPASVQPAMPRCVSQGESRHVRRHTGCLGRLHC